MRKVIIPLVLALILAGCDQNMEAQPKYSEYATHPCFVAGCCANRR